MIHICDEQIINSPYLERFTHGYMVAAGQTTRPAECHWHMVIVRHGRHAHAILVGPLPSAGQVSWPDAAESIWIKFALGTYMPDFPAANLLEKETVLPDASRQSFWLKGGTWELPQPHNVDVFVERLVRAELVVRDPLVGSVLQGYRQQAAPRTVRHRFSAVTGISQNQIYQITRAQQAADLLAQGTSIFDVVTELGYFDQPHLTKALKRWVGQTPAQIVRDYEEKACRFVQDAANAVHYNTTILERAG